MSDTSGTRFDVVGIGSAIVDILAHTEDALLSKHDVAKGTMLWVDDKQSDAMYSDIGPAIETSGGSAANTMAGIASFGGKPAFIGKTKSDQIGQIFSRDIRTAGVHFETKPLSDGLASARCIILVTPRRPAHHVYLSRSQRVPFRSRHGREAHCGLQDDLYRRVSMGFA